MAQLAIYIDDALSRRLDAAARRAGMSRSRFVVEAVRKQLEDELPESFFAVLGTWEDDRGVEQILADIRRGPSERRAKLK
ncbi:MAG: ribbon-helix-helix protein, CopG family [Myxococcales bacterium]|nr:ribbon-helix-helix protein, CopG family [Myxococcales bacterium]